MNDDQIITQALTILQSRLADRDTTVGSASDARAFLTLKLAESEREVFAVLLLDARNQLIEYRELFLGSIASAAGHPREVVKAALDANAAAMIVAHNHPSRVAEPSQADIRLTETLADILSVVEVELLDHFVIGGIRAISMKERGLF